MPESLGVLVVPETAFGTKFTDTLEIDQDARLLYMGDRWSGGIDIFDIRDEKPTYLQTIKVRGATYGIAVAKSVNKIYVGLAGHTVSVIDIDPTSENLHKEITRIDTGGLGNTDLIDFDPVHQKVYAGNPDDGFMVAIDGITDEVVGRIEGLGNGLEQPRFNPVDGMVYLAGKDDNVLYQVDPATDKLLNTFDIVDACHPNGMAIDPATNQAILASSNKEHPHAVIWDFTEQKVLTVIEDTGPGDGAAYVASLDRFLFAASGYPGGPVMGIIGGDPRHLIENVPTKPGASWVAFDDVHRVVYAPAIESGRPALLSFRLE